MKKEILSVIMYLALLHITVANIGVMANEYSYSAKVYPISQRYVAKPDFKIIESRITIQNTGDDALFMVTSNAEKNPLIVDLLYLDNDQKWSHVKDPLLIKSKKSSIITIQIKPDDQLEQMDYSVLTDVTILPAYTPLTSSTNLQIHPKIRTKTVLSITETGYTSIKAKIAYFTNLDGAFILSDKSPKIILLMQNLNKYSLYVDGIIEIKNRDKSGLVKLIPTTIESNNQTHLRNVLNEKYLQFEEKLSAGKYDLYAKIKTGNSQEPTIFANYTLWVLPHKLIYSLVTSLIAVLIVAFFYHFINHKNGG